MHRKLVIFLMPAVMVAGILINGSSAAPQATATQAGAIKQKTVWDGVYTAAQATRGQAEYAANCSKCHSNELDARVRGNGFIDRWREGSLASLFFKIRTDMPQDNPGSLTESTYVDILTHIMKANDFPSGTEDLTRENLVSVRVQKKSGPEPLPDFSIVHLVGCLTQDVNNVWHLTNASDPERTTEVDSSTAAELEVAKVRPLGTKTFRLQNFEYLGPDFNRDAHKGHKMQTKGTLIKIPNRGEIIQLTSMEMIAPTCAP